MFMCCVLAHGFLCCRCACFVLLSCAPRMVEWRPHWLSFCSVCHFMSAFCVVVPRMFLQTCLRTLLPRQQPLVQHKLQWFLRWILAPMNWPRHCLMQHHQRLHPLTRTLMDQQHVQKFNQQNRAPIKAKLPKEKKGRRKNFQKERWNCCSDLGGRSSVNCWNC